MTYYNSDDKAPYDETALLPPARVISGPPMARLFCRNQFEYLINKTRIIVGRTALNKNGQTVDVEINDTLYVSRQHFEIYTIDCCQFHLIVLGKNGLFVDGMFRRYHSVPCLLSKMCRIRFPKTNIKLYFQILDPNQNYPDPTNFLQPPINNFESNNITTIKREASPDLFEMEAKRPKLEDPADESNSYNNHYVQPIPETPPDLRFSRLVSFNKPPFSYSQMIAQAISLTVDKQLSLNDIYNYISATYPYYRLEDKGWQNSIRHNLSLNPSFVRIKRPQDEGKGSLWAVVEPDDKHLMRNAFKAKGASKRHFLDHGNNSSEGFTGSMICSDESLDILDEDFCQIDGQILTDINPFPIIINNNNLPSNYDPEPSTYFTTNIISRPNDKKELNFSQDDGCFGDCDKFANTSFNSDVSKSSGSIFAKGQIIKLSSF